MKKLVCTMAFVIVAASMVLAQTSERPSSVPGQTYGAVIKEKGAIDIVKVKEIVEKSEDGKAIVKIKAKVVDVCPKKGCWMNLQVDDSTTIFVKMKDYAFFVPDDMVGKTVVLEGEAFEKVTSVNELKHYAEDAGKSQEEIDAIVAPEKSIRFLASGIVVPKKGN